MDVSVTCTLPIGALARLAEALLVVERMARADADRVLAAMGDFGRILGVRFA